MQLEPLDYDDVGTDPDRTDRGTSRAAILVFPTIMNPTPAVENKAQMLAEAGYRGPQST